MGLFDGFGKKVRRKGRKLKRRASATSYKVSPTRKHEKKSYSFGGGRSDLVPNARRRKKARRKRNKFVLF